MDLCGDHNVAKTDVLHATSYAHEKSHVRLVVVERPYADGRRANVAGANFRNRYPPAGERPPKKLGAENRLSREGAKVPKDCPGLNIECRKDDGDRFIFSLKSALVRRGEVREQPGCARRR